MTFPMMIPVGPWLVHPHQFFEALAYVTGFRLHLWLRTRAGDALTDERRMSLVAAAAVGAALGSKLMYWASDPVVIWQSRGDAAVFLGGKSIVGGLAGGLIAVEWVKRWLGIRRPTGDLFALPLAVGMMIGRIGCFLTGLSDHTYGLPTSLPWGVDFGDGIARHPTQLYEIAWLALLAAWIQRRARRPHRDGELFMLFMTGYMAFRLLVEWIKPGVPLAGLTAIQWGALALLAYYGWRWPQLARRQPEVTYG